MRRTIVTVAVLGLAFGGVAGAYDGAPVTGGGSVSGQVKFAGTPPAPEKFDVTKDQEICGQEKTKPDLLVASGGGLANAVVVVKATKGKPLTVPTEPVTFDQKGCEYHPHVLAFPAGSTVRVLNPDGPPDILNGDDEMQMRALRDYVMSIGLPPAQVAEAHPPAATATP